MDYTISFFINGYGQQPNSISNINTIPELPILEEDGFIFEGWYLEEDLINKAEVGTELTSDITLYACWTRERGYTNTNTPVAGLEPSLEPEIDITSGEPGIVWSTSQVDGYFFQLLNSTKTNIEDLKSKSGRGDISYTNFIKAGSYLSGYAPMESWRSVSFDGFKYKASDNTVKNIEFLSRMSLPYLTTSNRHYEKAGSSADTTIDITPFVDGTSSVGLTFVSTVSGSTTTTKVKITEVTNSYNVPKFIIFELQAAGGGGGSSGSDYKNGAGGAGGGFATGVLKLDFNVFSKYRIVLGKYGAGGTNKNRGGSASASTISGIKSDGTTVELLKASGGAGGYCHNYSDWNQNDRYSGGGCSIPSSGEAYVFCRTFIGGGAGGYTNGWLDCTGEETTARTAYYTAVESYKTISGWYKSYSAQAGGDSGSSGESGGGGAAALGSGGKGGLTASKGSNGNGYGSGGGGGRWTVGGAAKAGGDGAPAYVAIYY